MAMNKVYMALTLVFIFSLLAIPMVESRTLTEILEKIRPTKAAASTSMEAKSKLNGALPRNLEPDALLVKDGNPTSSLRPIRANDAKPIMMKVDRTKPIRLPEYLPSWLIDNSDPIIIGDDNIDAEATKVTDQPERTATVETEPTPISVPNSRMRASVTEPVINYTRCDFLEESPNTNNAESTNNVQSTQVIDQPKGTATGGTEQTSTSVAKSMLRNLPTELVTNYSTSSSEYESIDADLYVVTEPRNLEVNDELSTTKLLPTTSSSKSLRSVHSTPTSVANSVLTTSLEPVTNYSQKNVIEENSKTGEELMEYVTSTEVTNHPEGTATVRTESTRMSVSNSTMLPSHAEVTNYTQVTQSSVIEEIPKTRTDSSENVKTVPRAIGAHVFYGKMVSGSEMYNMTADEYHNKIYPTHNCDVFLIGKLLKVADTPHNRMVFAKFAEEAADSSSDDSTEKEVPLDK
ncbi:uncharacterized protein LOC141670712 [Apium graveolens]|uniref:uncharacterized protein LOC141670712 n=1 Tax=Apium graveolens TaxID=4045 RepID=UPI003D798E93